MKSLIPTFAFLLILSISSALFAQSSIPIRETTPYPDSVLYSASALLPDGRVIVWGGQKQVQTPNGKVWLSNKSYIYEPVAEVWSEGPVLHSEVISPLVVTLANGDIMSIGGQGYVTIAGIDSFPMRTDHVEMLDVSENQWVVVDSIPFGSSPYTGTSGILLPDSNVWMTTTNGDYGTFDTETMTWADQSGIFGPLDAGGRPIVILDNGIIFHTGAGGQYYDMTSQLITYADPVIPMHTENVVKLLDGRILTWEDDFSFSQEAIIVNETGTASAVTDSLVIPGQLTTGVRMPDGKVWVFGLGEIGFGPYTLLQIFDPATDTWSSPGTYTSNPRVLTGYHMHLLEDNSIVVITTAIDANSVPLGSYRINAGSAAGIRDSFRFLEWEIAYDQHSLILDLLPSGASRTEHVEFTLTDLQGKTLQQESISSRHSLDLNHLPAGVYVARLQGDDGAWMVRKIQVH